MEKFVQNKKDGKKLFGNTILSFSVSLILCAFAGVMVVNGKIGHPPIFWTVN